MNCKNITEYFSGYMDGTLEQGVAEVVEQHLKTCQKCRAEYDALNAAVLMLEELPEMDAPSGFHAAVMNRIREERLAAPQKISLWKVVWENIFNVKAPARAFAMGAAAMLLVVVTMWVSPLGGVISGIAPAPSATSVANPGDGTVPEPVAAATDAALITDISSVDRNGELEYVLTIGTGSDNKISYSVFVGKKKLSSGTLTSETKAAVNIPGDVKAANVVWSDGSHSYTQTIEMPTK